jgi:photosystem II stability/assembly factor-like uncharacterized protein
MKRNASINIAWSALLVLLCIVQQRVAALPTHIVSSGHFNNPLVLIEAGETFFRMTNDRQGWTQLYPPVGATLGDWNGIGSHGAITLRGYDDDIVRSTDGGATWDITGRTPITGGALYASPVLDTLFLCYDDQVYRSENAGAEWTQVRDGGCNGVAFSPDFGDDGIAFLGLTGNIYKTQDGGDTWVEVWDYESPWTTKGGVPSYYPSYPCRLVVSPQFTQDRTVFANAHV